MKVERLDVEKKTLAISSASSLVKTFGASGRKRARGPHGSIIGRTFLCPCLEMSQTSGGEVALGEAWKEVLCWTLT